MSDKKPASKKKPMTVEEKRAKDRADGFDIWDLAIPVAGAAIGRRYGAKAGRAAAGLTPTGRRAAVSNPEVSKAVDEYYALREKGHASREQAEDAWNNMTKEEKRALSDADYRKLNESRESGSSDVVYPASDPKYKQAYKDKYEAEWQGDKGAFFGGAAGLGAGGVAGQVVNSNAKWDPIRNKPRMWDGKKR